VPGDYDGDGTTDIAIWSGSAFWKILRSSTGFASSWEVQWGSRPAGDEPVVGDYDGDGRNDLGVWRRSTGRFWIKRSSSNYSSSTSPLWGQAGSNDMPIPR
jgi:hypothetical protein